MNQLEDIAYGSRGAMRTSNDFSHRCGAIKLAPHDFEALIAAPDFFYVKRDVKTQAGVATMSGGEQVFVKRFVARSWLNGLYDLIRGSRASRSMRGARILARQGFLHPRPISSAQARTHGSIRISYLLSQYLENAATLTDVLAATHADALRRQLLNAVAVELARLHRSGVYSWDLQAANIMLERSGAAVRIYFVDLLDFRRGRPTAARRCLNLAQLDLSAGRLLRRGERLRFMHDYLGSRGRIPRRLIRRIFRVERGLRCAAGND